MRGLISFILIFAIMASVLIVYSIFHVSTISASEISVELLAQENHYARQLEIKRAITNAMIHGAREELLPTSISDGVTENVGKRLAELESLEDSYWNVDRLAVNFWCGTTTDEEIYEMLDEMHALGRTVKCNSCKDMDVIVIRNQFGFDGEYEPNPVHYCTSFLSANIIARYVLVGPPDPRITPPILLTGSPILGASIYDSRNGLVSVVTVPMSTLLRY